MKIYSRYKLTVLLIVLFGQVHAQINRLNSSVSVSQPLTPEKAYLHTDKPYYGAGDTIWFKGYTVTGDNRLSGISGLLHVELINTGNEIVRSLKLPMVWGLAYGDIPLPDTLAAGSYRLRAWTNWQRNFGPEYFFDRKLDIINAIAIKTGNNGIKTKEKATSNAVNEKVRNNAKTAPADLQFFPEGGYLVNGIPSKIAFKAIGSDGLSREVSGTILDENNNEITKFASSHLGMGLFVLLPQAGKKYSAKVNYPNGDSKTLALPAIRDAGYVMQVNNTNADNIKFRVIPVNADEHFSLKVQAGGETYYQVNSQPGKSLMTAEIPKDKLPSGIVKLMLYNSKNEPVNERQVFVYNPNDQLNIQISAAEKSNPLQKIKIDIDVKDKNNQPMSGNFSVAVINTTDVPINEDKETTIYSALLLTSGLKGYVEQPNYYFTANHINNAEIQAQLDNLLLTQGYGLYEQKLNTSIPTRAITLPTTQIAYQPEKDLNINGRISDLRKKPVANSKVYLVNKTNLQLTDTITDQEGRFSFDKLAFSGNAAFTIKVPTKGDRDNVIITVDNGPLPAVQVVALPADNAALQKYAQTSKAKYDEEVKYNIGGHTIMLKEVKVNRTRIQTDRQKAIERWTEYSGNLNGRGIADQVITAEDLEQFGGINLADKLTGRLAGVEFSEGVPYLVRAQNRLTQEKPVMGVILNGAPVGEVKNGGGWAYLVQNIPPSAIASIEVLRSINYSAIYGSTGGAGVLVVTTKHGGQDRLPDEKPSGVLDFNFNGYTINHTFYSPQYKAANTAPQTDLRNTIYWNPIVEIDKTGRAVFEYFNSLKKGDYRVVVEGVGLNGGIGRAVYQYKVD
ncbi:MAG: TonB-dependent receptor [Sphingobacteriaceae bacterium]|nr:MAG: TonB-dependent receptor [Sphingobacteriaceae bacterium]